MLPAIRCARPVVQAVTAALTAGAALAAAGTASAGTVAALTVGGAPLAGSTLTAAPHTVTVSGADAGTSAVRFVLDGVYVGIDTSAPFTVTIAPQVGAHVLKARLSVGTAVQRVESVFTTAAATTAPSPTPTPITAAPAPAPTTSAPAPAPTTSAPPPATVAVSTAAQLTAALAAARPGTVISLADGRYPGRFVAAVPGTASAPIVVRGGRGAVLDGGSSGYAVHLRRASHWRLEGFSITGGAKGVVLDASTHVSLLGLDVGRTGQEGVHFRSGSSDGVLADSVVHHTGLVTPGFGEGVYIGSATSNWGTYSGGAPDRSDRVRVLRTRIYATTAESIDVKEGTTGGLLQGNSFDGALLSGANYADSWLDIKGNGYRVLGNTGTSSRLDGIQTHVAVSGWGQGNTFAGNVLRVNGPGRGFVVQSPATTGNVVSCDNVVSGAAGGFGNVSCR